MKTNINTNINTPVKSDKILKLAIDAHVKFYLVAMMYGSCPKPTQRFKPADFLAWIVKQIQAGYHIISSYEAGPLGFVLHRNLTSLGVVNYVIKPRDWDDDHKKRKTDRWDARKMLSRLDSFLAGDAQALCLVRVPTEEQEHRRSLLRLRDSFQGEIKRLAQRARGMALNYGFNLKGQWFGPRNWPRLQSTLPEWFEHLLCPLRQSILVLQEQVKKLNQEVQALAPAIRPAGMGPLTWVALESEICDWHRFNNRNQVGSLAGLIPSEDSSGERRHLGPITKCGNQRVRQVLCELAWRLLLYQPDYRRVKIWKAKLLLQNSPSRRKELLVALARGFAVDWWRLRTDQTTPEKLGIKMSTK